MASVADLEACVVDLGGEVVIEPAFGDGAREDQREEGGQGDEESHGAEGGHRRSFKAFALFCLEVGEG